MSRTRNSAFTLVEILIVVIILGILAAIVVPQFTDASNEARLSRLQSDLQSVRSQIELYKMQHGGDDPSADATANNTDFWTQLTTKTDAAGAAGGNLGPYLQNAPTNPFVVNAAGAASSDVNEGAAADAAGTDGWNFDATTGKFTALGSDGDGNALSDL